MDARILVDGVGHAFGGRPVLENVDLQVGPHELLCVVGRSGCGKTTLLRILGGLLRPTQGRVLIHGDVVSGPSARVAMVFQHFGLFPWKSVRANIGYGLANRGHRDPERVERLIDTMGLQGAGELYPRQLSGGMQQRVGLARALAVEPEVLLMDEPFGSLDALTREQLQDELLRIWDRDPGVTGVFITHDIDEAILLGDRIVALVPDPGRVRAEIAVPIPRPRTGLAVRAYPGYPALREAVWHALRPEAAEPAR
ncbi:MAG TPA: ABC transporter ATP-binding protein [Candidatus Dormibacteraeota bacterium]|nr:ABC transporter ATP-binding protein [Candidatus Dormibacteraeota bacterium]